MNDHCYGTKIHSTVDRCFLQVEIDVIESIILEASSIMDLFIVTSFYRISFFFCFFCVRNTWKIRNTPWYYYFMSLKIIVNQITFSRIRLCACFFILYRSGVSVVSWMSNYLQVIALTKLFSFYFLGLFGESVGFCQEHRHTHTHLHTKRVSWWISFPPFEMQSERI